MFVHTVFFWLKPDVSPTARAALLQDCRQLLEKIPTVQQIWAGTPVPSPRPVVDGSYAVGLTVIFTDAAGHDVYQDHPLHLEFIARHKAIWQRVQVYDFAS
jgi:hypothetical protein